MNFSGKATGLVPAIIFMLFFFSCDSDSPQKSVRQVSFGFTNTERSEGGRLAENKEPDKIRITVERDGELVLNQVDLTFLSFGSGYVTESIELEVGSYAITHFLVLDNEEVIYATPIEGSENEDLVKDALPLYFEVTAEDITTVVPEVLPVASNDNPEQFGYANFGFEIVNNFSLELSLISDWDSSYVNATWTFVSFDADSTMLEELNIPYMKDVQEHAILDKEAAFYEVTVDHPVYHPVTHYFETGYLEGLNALAYSLSPKDFTQEFKLSDELFGLNEISIHVPKNGCFAYARVDATGVASLDKDGYVLTIDRVVRDNDTQVNLKLPNMVQIVSNPNLIYLPGYNASGSPNECEEFPGKDIFVDVMMLGEVMGKFVFLNVLWDEVDKEWVVSSSSMEDPVFWGQHQLFIHNRTLLKSFANRDFLSKSYFASNIYKDN